MKISIDFEDGNVKIIEPDKILLRIKLYIREHKITMILLVLGLILLQNTISIIQSEIYNNYIYFLFSLQLTMIELVSIPVMIVIKKIKKYKKLKENIK